MKAAFLTPSISRAAGGIFEIERDLAHALVAETPTNVAVFGLEDAHSETDRPTWAPLEPTVLPTKGPGAFGYAPGLVPSLINADVDVLHLHALWMYTSVATLSWAQRTGRPHIVTINGMLDPWAVQNSAWRKKLAAALYERKMLDGAACVQVNTHKELRAVRDYGVDAPACVVPNGVTLPDDDVDTRPPPWADAVGRDDRVLLFLGRIHPKKGIDVLLEAWSSVETATAGAPWHLAIVGWDDGGHEAALRQYTREAGLSRVHFLGPRFGDEKDAAFRHADAFVLPSYSEGLPMAVLEAWSYRLPVIYTRHCNLPAGIESGAALEIPSPDGKIAVHDVESTLQSFFALPSNDVDEMGQRGRALVESTFSWEEVAQEIYRVYEWVTKGGERPDSVVESSV